MFAAGTREITMLRTADPAYTVVCDNCKRSGPGARTREAAYSAARVENFHTIIFGPGPTKVDYCSIDCAIESGLLALPGPELRPDLCPYCEKKLELDAWDYLRCHSCDVLVRKGPAMERAAKAGGLPYD